MYNCDCFTFTEIVRIYDGNTSLRKRVYRTVAVPKNAPAQVLLEAALRTYHISDDPANYYLAEVTDKGSYWCNLYQKDFVICKLHLREVTEKEDTTFYP